MRARTYYIYILASASGVLYTGVTNNLHARLAEHRQKQTDGFTKRYNITRLVHYEAFSEAKAAIEREKQIKGWRREKRIKLIELNNPKWTDLSVDWFSNRRERL